MLPETVEEMKKESRASGECGEDEEACGREGKRAWDRSSPRNQRRRIMGRHMFVPVCHLTETGLCRPPGSCSPFCAFFSARPSSCRSSLIYLLCACVWSHHQPCCFTHPAFYGWCCAQDRIHFGMSDPRIFCDRLFSSIINARGLASYYKPLVNDGIKLKLPSSAPPDRGYF